MTAALEQRLEQLERRLGAAEDEIAIIRLMARYGLAIDAGDADAVTGIWTAEGIYDLERGTITGTSQIHDFAQALAGRVRDGLELAHVLGLPHVRLAGDNATALCHSLLFRHENGQNILQRIAANRWDFVRTSSGWKVARRTNRAMEAEGRTLFRETLAAQSVEPEWT